jgi:glucose-1-phosphate cytidylyltransferase
MKVFILVGGLGTRFGLISKVTPKPLITIGGMPILWHLIRNFVEQGFLEIYLLCRSSNLEDFNKFVDQVIGSDKSQPNFIIPSLKTLRVLDTGNESTTADRIFLGCDNVIQDKNENFVVTYGDSLLDIDLLALVNYFTSNSLSFLVTAVTPPIAYATLTEKNGLVSEFQEKKWPDQIYVSGGYFILNLAGISTFYVKGVEFESSILPALARKNLLGCYLHPGFWHPMDNEFDRSSLEALVKSDNAPWIIW